MNIWKPGAKKNKKQLNEPSLPVESETTTAVAADLPDVVAGLSFDDSEHGIATSSEGAMIGYSYFSDSQEARGRRREPRSQNAATPKGLGVTPSGSGYLPHQELGVVPAPPQTNSVRRQQDLPQVWPPQMDPQSDTNWNQASFQADAGSYAPSSANWQGDGDLHGARIRSMSSEPHGATTSRGDRRIRCSSATRNSQSRPRKQNNADISSAAVVAITHQSHIANLPSPSTSPPVQTIEYQQTTTSGSAPPVDSSRPGSNFNIGTTQEYSREEREPPEEIPAHSENSAIGGSYGYQVPDLEALLTQASPNRPANLPMVLASPTRLHNMRRSQENPSNQLPVRPILPLGIIVNAVFKTRDWLFVRTAHGAEGYVPYRVCLPLGILPPRRSSGNGDNNNTNRSPWEIRSNDGPSIGRLSAPKQTFPNTNTLGMHPMGRQRGRRRTNVENTNQTDLQKLQPSGNVGDSRFPREVHNSSSNSHAT